ncbi:hypothetical protein CHUAL_000886 [Chamberlinius hualienensis]
MSVQFKLIAAACEQMGIGKNNGLPWRLKNEMAYFTRMTTTVSDPNKKNAIIMGRRTWLSTPAQNRPLKNRISIVLSRNATEKIEGAHYVASSLENCIDLLQKAPLVDQVESVWIIGGEQIYRAALEMSNTTKIYLTRIMANYDCDTFFPPIPTSLFKKISEEGVPEEVQDENNIKYQYEVYERTEN